jgi:hypothetical protein
MPSLTPYLIVVMLPFIFTNCAMLRSSSSCPPF